MASKENQEIISMLKSYINENYVDNGFISISQLIDGIDTLQQAIDENENLEKAYKEQQEKFNNYVKEFENAKNEYNKNISEIDLALELAITDLSGYKYSEHEARVKLKETYIDYVKEGVKFDW